MRIASDGSMSVGDVAMPQVKAGTVRIRVAAAAVNPTDLAMRSMGRLMTGVEGPWVPGMDAAGVVDAVAAGSRYDVGQRVMAITVPYGTRTGAQAEYVTVPEASIAPIDDSLAFAEAATIPMNALTAHQALAEMNLAAGETVAVTGGAGHLASYFTAFAVQRGMRVIADAAPAERDAVRSSGAAEVVDRGPGVAERIRQLHPDGVGAVLDTALLGAEIVPAVRDGGMVVAVRPGEISREREIEIRPILVSTYARNDAAVAEVAHSVREGVISGRVAGVYPVEQAESAYRRMAEGGVRGRLVIDFGPVQGLGTARESDPQ
ncbi:NADP-dependent oxidoreductase [Rhodococcus sp. CSLK01-03]|uniref:NADP-dependent oxidoreductase n=1 Tax=Rhodococcus indonesiensis TaxID=3055869 RepID=A0ABT7RNW9_9NOCA|nr:NADP-dependent oxidoreductase [Rhodococcus indonesiensis]MDM7489338.1 NADP-dependent oxidoreductase [Rhodococcus indonesiensis]